jgi:carboxymethylenebutenolidase
MKAGLDELERRASGQKLGAIGFCFGGGMTWLLLASGEPRLAASAPFYGPLPDGADFSGSPNAAVLGVYAEQDDRVNATRDAATAALERAGLTHEIVTYQGAGHAFFNDTSPRYNQAAATRPTPRSSTGSATPHLTARPAMSFGRRGGPYRRRDDEQGETGYGWPRWRQASRPH